MKKILLMLLITLLVPKISFCEDTINVMPFEAKVGAVSEDAMCFQIEMVSSQDYWGIQFDLFLPNGMTLDTTGGLDPYDTELNEDRYPFTVDRRGNKTYKHSVQWSIIDSGAYRFVVSPDDNESFIAAGSGEVLTLYYLTDETFADGIHPFIVENTVMAISGNSGVRPNTSSSYCVVGESPMNNDSYLDLSSLIGYMPSFVVSKINDAISLNEKLTEINLTGLTSAYSELHVENPNVLSYYKSGTEISAMLSSKDNIIIEDNSSYSCSSLLLNEDYPFSCSHTISVAETKLVKSLCNWNTICLPFSIRTTLLQEIFGEYTYLISPIGYNENTFVCAKTGADNLPNTPYILVIGNLSKIPEVINFGSVTIQPSDTSLDVNFEELVFKGNYSGDYVDKTMCKLTESGRFSATNEENPIKSFEAAISIPKGANVVDLMLTHDLPTSVNQTIDYIEEFVDVYSITGICVKHNVLRKDAFEGLDKGIYLINNKKYILY